MSVFHDYCDAALNLSRRLFFSLVNVFHREGVFVMLLIKGVCRRGLRSEWRERRVVGPKVGPRPDVTPPIEEPSAHARSLLHWAREFDVMQRTYVDCSNDFDRR